MHAAHWRKSPSGAPSLGKKPRRSWACRMGAAGNLRIGGAGRGLSMATKLTPKKSAAAKLEAKKAPAKRAAANGPAASAGAENEGGDLRSTLSPGKTASA